MRAGVAETERLPTPGAPPVRAAGGRRQQLDGNQADQIGMPDQKALISLLCSTVFIFFLTKFAPVRNSHTGGAPSRQEAFTALDQHHPNDARHVPFVRMH